jgi:two-component system sensor kinase FixL
MVVDDVTKRASPAPPPDSGAGNSPLLDQLLAISRSSALEEMASGIAHELNQPLGAITTFAQAGERMLNRPDVSIESAREVFQLISKEALAAAEGIRRMRRLFNRESIAKEPVAIDDVVRELANALELLAQESGIELTVNIASALPAIDADRLRIQHVLYTLVQNAFEATLANEAARRRAVSIDVKGDRYGVEISVVDSGNGVPNELRPKMFHPFFTTKPAGTGLGLASARAIVQAHEGTIGFDDAPNGGSRFWFRLPAA